MNLIEDYVKAIPGRNRFERRDNLANWLQSFIRTPDCQSIIVERIDLPNNEYYQYVAIRAYSHIYYWVDYMRDNLLDTSRLERVEGDDSATILFSDDFGTKPITPCLALLADTFGKKRIFPKEK